MNRFLSILLASFFLTFSVCAQVPPAPLINPVSPNTTGEYTISWSTVPNVMGYELLEYGVATGYSNTFHWTSANASQSFTKTYSGSWYYAVRTWSVNAQGQYAVSPYSPVVEQIVNVVTRPSIGSVAGNFTQDGTVSISGLNFGQKTPAPPLVWADFENGVLQPSSLGQRSAWDENLNMEISSALPNNDSEFCASGTWKTLSKNPANRKTSFYFGVRKSSTNAWSKAYHFQKRRFSFSPSNVRFWCVKPDTGLNMFEAYYSAGAGYCVNGVESSPPGRKQGSAPARNQWLTEEFLWQFSGGSGLNPDGTASASSGVWDYTRDGIAIQHRENVNNGTANQLALRTLNFTPDGKLPANNSQVFLDDIYIDDTCARVMIGNSPIFESCTRREIMIPKSWSDGLIVATFNRGSFVIGERAYLFVIDANNKPSAGYGFTVGAASAVYPGRLGTYPGGGLGLWGPPANWDWDVSLAQPLGIGVVRFNSDVWSLLEPQPGVYDWTRLDNAVAALKDRGGIDLLFTIPIAASWNGPAPTTNYASVKSFATALATRYRGKIKYYEMWNEPDFPPYWKGAPNADEYFPYMKAAYEGIKAGDPGAVVVIGGLSNPRDPYWMTRLMQLGGGNYFDAMNVHFYPAYSNFEDGLNSVRKVLQQFGKRADIWITETSTTGAYFDTTDRAAEEYKKAVYLVQNYAYALGQNDVKAVFWHTLRNPGRDVGMPKDYDFGLMTLEGSPLPAYDAHRVLSEKLLGAMSQGRADLGSGLIAHQFQNAGKTIYVVWSRTGNNETAILPANLNLWTVTTMFGQSQELDRNQAMSRPIGAEPVYFEGR